jgi:CRISPR-associated endonuclease/helicase Cas3
VNKKYTDLAKPSGITLDQHKKNVMSEGWVLSSYYPYTFKKYQERTGKSLEKRIEHVTNFHDDGKQNEKWQMACQLDYNNYLSWKQKYGGSWQEYTSKMYEEAGKHLQKAGVRHEFQSLVINEKKRLPICLQAAIAAHHGKLGFKFEDRWIREGVEGIWKTFQRESNRVIDERMSLSEVANLHYEFAGPRGYLQLTDRRASAIEDGDFVPDHKPFKYQFPHSEKRNVQRLIEEHWQDELLLIRAATGAGKTDASLLWASKQIENGKAERLIIAMPTRFTSNALSINVAESLSSTGLYHSSAWFTKFQEKIEAGTVSKKEASKEHEFARLLQTPVTVCTIDHLLMALTLTREDHHLITFNLANSCLVVDEADFYDNFTQANILVLLEILKYWNVPVLLMSASLPDSVLSDYQKIGYPVTEIKEDNIDQEEYLRSRFEIKSIVSCAMPLDIENLLENCLSKGNAIIYANTVDRAMEFLNWFDDKGIDTCLYHSRFTEPDKMEKEKILIQMLGRDAWESGTARGIAILTQIGEMSINISADLMISDLCPIDRLTQRAGRLCRFDKSKLGVLHVLVPERNDKIYPAPYGRFDRKEKSWVSSESFEKTRQIISCQEYSAQSLVKILNDVYEVQSEFSALALSNAKNLKEYYKNNWLINSKQISNKDDSGVNFWKSRDIPPQETVFVSIPENKYFSNYLGYQDWKLKNGLELPIYLIDKGKKNFVIDLMEVVVKEDMEHLFVIREGFYTIEKGVDLNIPEEFI